MEKEKAKVTLYQLEYTASLNELYFGGLAFWVSLLDRTVRMSVGVVAIFALAFPQASFWLAIGALLIAVVLNVLPLHNWEWALLEFQKRWSEHRSEIEALEIKEFQELLTPTTVVHEFPGSLSKGQAEKVTALLERRHSLQSEERIKLTWYASHCQKKIRRRRYGPRVRTHEQEQRAAKTIREKHISENPKMAG